MADSFYCPFCQKNIEPERDDSGEIIQMECGGGRVFVHDNVPHDPDYQFEGLQ